MDHNHMHAMCNFSLWTPCTGSRQTVASSITKFGAGAQYLDAMKDRSGPQLSEGFLLGRAANWESATWRECVHLCRETWGCADRQTGISRKARNLNFYMIPSDTHF